MSGFPAPVNNNLNHNNSPVPIASNIGAPGSLGGIKADGVTIVVDQTTGVAQAVGGTGGIAGTAGFIPKFATAASINNSPIDYGVTTPATLTNPNDTYMGVPQASLNPLIQDYTPAQRLRVADVGTPGVNVAASIQSSDVENTTGLGLIVVRYAESPTPTGGQVAAAEFDGYAGGVNDYEYISGSEHYAEMDGAGTCDILACAIADQPVRVAGTVNIAAAFAARQGITASVGGINAAFYSVDQAGNYGLYLDGNSVAFIGGVLKTRVYSVAGTPLPLAATAGIGARAFVSDAVANTFNTAYVGGGANKMPVFSDGAAWHIG